MSVDIGTISGKLALGDGFSEPGGKLLSLIPKLNSGIDALVDKINQIGKGSSKSVPKVVDETEKLKISYAKLSAQIDPVVAGEQKLAKATEILEAAHKKGLATHEEYLSKLDKAKTKFSDTSTFAQKLGRTVGEELNGKFKVLSETIGRFGGETGRALEGLSSKSIGAVSSIKAAIGGLGPLLPLAAALVVALLTVGVAFKAFEFVKDAVSEGLELQHTIELLNESLRNTGSYSGLTGKQLTDLADKYEILTGRTDNEIIAAETILTKFKNLNEQSFPRALESTLAYAKAMGITADAAASKLGPALDGNSKSLAGLKEAGIDLTKGQKATLTQLVETGKIVEYQALLFDILDEKVGKVSDQFDGNLIRQGARVGVVFDDLKEGIASELIPALEDLTVNIIDQLGGWEHLKELASTAGHWLGDRLRAAVYIVIIGFHEMAGTWDQVAIAIDRGILMILGTVKKFADVMASLPIFGDTWKIASDLISSSMASVTDSLFKDTVALGRHQKASHEAVLDLYTHRQALEGSTDTYKKHGAAQDEVESKTKDQSAAQEKLNKLLLDGSNAIRDYDNKLGDLLKKLTEQSISQNALLGAAGRGVFAYAQAKQEQEKFNVVEAVTIQLAKDHRVEIEKLQDVESKLRASHNNVEADKISAQIKKEIENYDKESKAVATLAGNNFDLKVSTDQVLKSTQSNYEFTNKVLTLQTELTDAIEGTSFASREMSIHIETERRQLDELKTTEGDLADSIAETVRREHERLDVMRDVIDVARELNNLDNQASLQTEITRIDTSTSRYLQEIERQYLETVASIGNGSIEEGKRVIAETQKVFDELGIDIGDISEKIRTNLQQIQDAQIISSVQGSSKTPYDLYKEERDKIVAVMKTSSGQVKSNAADLAAYLEKLDSDFFITRASIWASALDGIGNLFGGFLSKITAAISKSINNVVSAYQTGQKIGGALNSAGIGGQGLGGSLGGILAVVQIFYEIYNAVDSAIKKQRARTMEPVTSLQAIGGNFNAPEYINNRGREFDLSMRSLVDQVLASITGTLDNMPEIIIRARKDGKKFAAYVGGIFLGLFNDADEAMSAAVAQAISTSSFIGLSAELARALEASFGKTLEELQHNIETATNVRNARIGEAGAAYVEVSDRNRSEIEAADRLGLSIIDLIAKRNREQEAIKNSALGINTAASDRLRDLRSLDAGIAEVFDSSTAQLQQYINDAMTEIARLEGRGPQGAQNPRTTPGGGVNPGGAADALTKEISDAGNAAIDALRESIRQYQSELDKIPKALTDQEINMGVFDTLYQYLQDSPKYAQEAAKWARIKVEIEFAQIKAQLLLLNKWEEFSGMFTDAYNAALGAAGRTGRGHGGGNSDKQSVQSFIDDRRFQLFVDGLDDVHARLAQLNKDYDEQLKSAGKDNKLRADLIALREQETALIIKQNQLDVLSRFRELTVGNDPFTQLHDKFTQMATDIKNAGFGAARTARLLDTLTQAEHDAIETLGRQSLGNLFSNLAGYIDDQVIKQDALAKAAQIKFTLDMLSYKADFELLKAKKVLTDAEINAVNDLFDYIDKNPPNLSGSGSGNDTSVDTTPLPSVNDHAVAAEQDRQNYLNSIGQGNEAIRQATDLLRSYQTNLQDELTKELSKINSDFSIISTALGNTAEVIAAKNAAISNAIDNFLEPVRSFRNSMDFNPQTSTLSGRQQFTSIRDQFRELSSHATLADRDQLLALAEQYRGLGRQATSGQGYRFIDQEIKGILDTFIANTPAAAGLGTNTNPMSVATPQLQQAVELGNSMIVTRLRDQNDNIITTNDILSSIDRRLSGGLSVSGVA